MEHRKDFVLRTLLKEPLPNLLAQYNLVYNTPSDKFELPLGLPDNRFTFAFCDQSFTILKNGEALARLVLPDTCNRASLLEFAGRFQFFSLSYHFYIKWRGGRLRMKWYFSHSLNSLIGRLHIFQSTPERWRFENDSDLFRILSNERNPLQSFKDSRRFENRSEKKKIQFLWLISLAASSAFNEINFKRENNVWAAHLSMSRQLYARQLLLSSDRVDSQRRLSFLYLQSGLNSDYSGIDSFPFIKCMGDKIQIDPPNNYGENTFYFRQVIKDSVVIEGNVAEGELKRLLIRSHGAGSIRLRTYISPTRLFKAHTCQTAILPQAGSVLFLDFSGKANFLLDF